VKYVFFVPDGAADYAIDELGGQTPLEFAATPNMDFIAREGRGGLVQTIPEGMGSGSDIATLSLMGYDPREYYTGRGPLEAAYRGIRLRPGEYAYRCNLVTERDGKLIDYSAGHISTTEAAELIASLDKGLGTSNIGFKPGVSYRHLLILKEGGSDDTVCHPPHDVLDQRVEDILPAGEGSELLRDLIDRSREILSDHPVNKHRVASGQNPANLIWPWGQGGAPRLTTFKERFGMTGSVISAVDVIKGIGFYMGLKIIEVPGATGYFDTDYDAKARAALDALNESDFVFLHVEASDEAGHEGLVEEKVRALENFDRRLVGPVLAGLKEMGEFRVLVSPDHETPLVLRTHGSGPVPFALYATDGKADDMTAFSEKNARAYGSLQLDRGYDLIYQLLS
jgi:2,3-bisphosphoglycerate-independent phosphoglycerate mutase